MKNYNKLNSYRYRFLDKKTNKTSFFDGWCYGNIWQQIEIYKNDLSKMCLLGISNDTHKLIEVIHLFDNSTIYKAED